MIYHSSRVALAPDDKIRAVSLLTRPPLPFEAARPILLTVGNDKASTTVSMTMAVDQAKAIVSELQKLIDELCPAETVPEVVRTKRPEDLVSNVISMSEGRIS